ncbi:hypothetical protein ACFDTO_26835 [Microbacteriaceae bacterium 4G12]
MKKIATILFIVTLFITTGCTPKQYDQNVKAGIKALQEEQYKEAVSLFKKAKQEKQTDEIQAYIDAAQNMQDGVTALEKGEFAKAIDAVKPLITSNDSSEVVKIIKPKATDLMKKAEDLQKQEKALNEKLIGAKALIKANKVEEATSILQEISKTETDHPALEQIVKQANGLIETTKQTKKVEAQQTETKKKEEPNKKEEASKQNQPDPGAKPKQLTHKQAEDLVRGNVNAASSAKMIVEYDHDNAKGDYVIHVYENVDDPQFPHTATLGWYAVNPYTGEVYNDLMQ